MTYFIMVSTLWTLPGLVAAGYAFKFSQNELKGLAYEEYYITGVIASMFFFVSGPIGLCLVYIFRINESGWGFHSRATAKKIQEEARKHLK